MQNTNTTKTRLKGVVSYLCLISDDQDQSDLMRDRIAAVALVLNNIVLDMQRLETIASFGRSQEEEAALERDCAAGVEGV